MSNKTKSFIWNLDKYFFHRFTTNSLFTIKVKHILACTRYVTGCYYSILDHSCTQKNKITFSYLKDKPWIYERRESTTNTQNIEILHWLIFDRTLWHNNTLKLIRSKLVRRVYVLFSLHLKHNFPPRVNKSVGFINNNILSLSKIDQRAV